MEIPATSGVETDRFSACPTSMNDTLVEFYRCPEEFINFAPGDELCALSGDSCFRPAASYGQSFGDSFADVASKSRSDSPKCSVSDESTPRMPLDSSQIVDYLRRERYMGSGNSGKRSFLSSEIIRRTYYYFRPLLPVSIRKHLQRLFHRDWNELSFPAWPVDTTVETILEKSFLLCMKARGIERIPFIWFWPEGTPSCVMVTHDVETKAGVRFVERLMDIDDAFGIKASFQVVPQKQYEVSQNTLNMIHERGFEVNVQDLTHDGDLFRDREEFLLKAQSINRYVREYGAQGFRSGRMYRNADWFDALDVSYDMSVPNVAHLEAQRGGCCTIFPYFIGRILELPLTTIQDYCLFCILGDYSIELWEKQIALITEKHGLASFIVHPDYVRKKRALAVYKSLLGYLSDLRKKGKVWIALPKEVNRWWRERSQMTLVREHGAWRIRGEGRERAKVAYAILADNKLRYSFD